ncbi:ADP-ribose pyrophosphatase, mitochondrial-like isoform X1 [Montipora capricornis]|uniref:ADP-ribose pyrophosphatase, mitochondrial-like isoform X1 n=2 Tax=Montipora capricornis TaxID=246305 RepID=UPI0035F1C8A3
MREILKVSVSVINLVAGLSLLTNQYPNIVNICLKNMHTKACTLEYPGTTVKRFPVPPEFVDWKAAFPAYKPVDYTSEKVLGLPPWADPEIRKGSVKIPLQFNTLDTVYNTDRTSLVGKYKVVHGVPRNPIGRTGMIGRGLLGRWGPNHAADPVVTRWKRNISGDKVIKDGKPVLEFVAIERRDCSEWALPGGMVEPGDTVTNTLKKEFGEEALNSMDLSPEENKILHKNLEDLFHHGTLVFQGYIDDPRNTDNSWMESQAVNYHDDSGKAFDRFSLKAGDDAKNVKWMEVSHKLHLYANHYDLIKEVAKRLGASW